MQIIPKFLLFIFAAFVLVQFALLQYVATAWPPRLEFQSNYINESSPYSVEETLIGTIAASPATTSPSTIFNQPTRGIELK